jgi:hypothetical protein
VRSKKEEEEEEKEKDLMIPTNEGTLVPAKTGLRLVPSLTWTLPIHAQSQTTGYLTSLVMQRLECRERVKA